MHLSRHALPAVLLCALVAAPVAAQAATSPRSSAP